MSRAVFSTNFDEDEKIWSGRSLNTLFNPNITLGQVILNTLNMMPEKVVQISAGTDKKITAMQMVGLSVRASQNYELSGYKQDDVIGLVASNTHFLAPLVFGAFLNGIIVNPLDPSFSKDEIKHMFNITKPKAVFCDSQVYENVKEALVEIECISPIYVMDDIETNAPSVRQFLKPTGREQTFIPPQLNQGEDPIAAIVCSSGTTGLPKGVIVTHRALLANCATSLPSTEVCFSFTTLYWLSGLTLLIMGTLRCFTRIIIDQPFSPEVLLYLIEKYKISVVVAPPSQMVLTVQSSHFKTLDLSSLKYYICGGSAVPINAAIEMKKHLTNVSLWISYALSETGGNVTFAFDLNNSVGQVAPNVQVKILDEDSKPLGIGAKGEICVKFLYKLYGYYCNVEATKNIFDEEGWLHTGDIGYFDELGYLYIVDRKKEIMKYKNFHFSPTEIEHVIMDIPDVVECCVFGVSDEVATDLPAAAIVKKEGSVLNEDDIRNHVTGHMADFKQLRGGVYFANSLPKTASGKIIRRKVKDFFDKRVDPINN